VTETNDVQAAELWRQLCDELEPVTASSLYASCFPGSKPVSLENEVLTVMVPNPAVKECFDVRLATTLARTLTSLGRPELRLSFVVTEEDRPEAVADQGENALVIVRDRRKARQYSIENLIMDEWFPILGATGYAIYSLYVRMANSKDERAWPAYSLVQRHLGIGAASVSEYNQLMEWCGLLHIEPGNHHSSNTYFILDPPAITLDLLQSLRQSLTGWGSNRRLAGTIRKRIQAWESLEMIWSDRRAAGKRIRVVRAGQTEAAEGEHDPEGLGSTLQQIGVNPTNMQRLLDSFEASRIRAAVERTRARQAETDIRNPGAYLCSLLDKGYV